jgi:hypothetical protein
MLRLSSLIREFQMRIGGHVAFAVASGLLPVQNVTPPSDATMTNRP